MGTCHGSLECNVTPYVGVWIETGSGRFDERKPDVTPYVGVWIETYGYYRCRGGVAVTPYVGVWIETAMPGTA